MIEWLVQTDSAHADLAHGVAPAGLLSPAEQARLAALKSAKRRHDWLLGRWTAKQLIWASSAPLRHRCGSLEAITVANDPSGAPYILAGGAHTPQPVDGLQLSISHSGSRAFCALTGAAGLQLGADIEQIEPRPRQFAEDYCTEDELALLRRAPAAWRDTLLTAIWSGKEAALKALRLGLSVDTRSVACLIAPATQAAGWLRFTIICDAARLGMPHAPQLSGWWRCNHSYVLTMAVWPTANHTHQMLEPLYHRVGEVINGDGRLYPEAPCA